MNQTNNTNIAQPARNEDFYQLRCLIRITCYYRESDTFGNEISILDTVLEDYVSCSSSITPPPLLQGRDI